MASGDIVIVWYSANSFSIKAQKIVPDYQADLLTVDTLGFELLNKFSEDSSICAFLSDDGVYALIAVANGYIQISHITIGNVSSILLSISLPNTSDLYFSSFFFFLKIFKKI